MALPSESPQKRGSFMRKAVKPVGVTPSEPVERPDMPDLETLITSYWQPTYAASVRGLLYQAADKMWWGTVGDNLRDRLHFLVSVASEYPAMEKDASLRITARQQIARGIVPELLGKSIAGEGGWERRECNHPRFQDARATSLLLLAHYAQGRENVFGLSKNELRSIHKMIELFWIGYRDLDTPREAYVALVNTLGLEVIKEWKIIETIPYLLACVMGSHLTLVGGDEFWKHIPSNIPIILEKCGSFGAWNPHCGIVSAHDVMGTLMTLLPALQNRHTQYQNSLKESAQ